MSEYKLGTGNKNDNGVLEQGTDEIVKSYQEDTPGQSVDEYIKEKEKAFHEQKNKIIDSIPLKKMGAEKDIAEIIYFLAHADYITGQIIRVDGGRSLN